MLNTISGKIKQWWARWRRCPYALRIDTLCGQADPDIDDLLLHASFQCLTDFVESVVAGRVQWSGEDENPWIVIRELYCWWRLDRPARKDPLLDSTLRAPDNLLDFFSKSQEQMTPQEQAFQQVLDDSDALNCLWRSEDQEMLLRLMRVRHHLWA